MIRLQSVMFAAALLAAQTGLRAEINTTPTSSDGRIQTVRFTPDDIVRIVAAEGVVTTIELGKGEQIRDFAMGDRDAWHAVMNGNLIVIKPKDVQADTNLTVFSNKRSYLFQLTTTHRKARNVAYWVKLTYPEQEDGSSEAQAALKKDSERKKVVSDLAAARFEGLLNYDYWIVGPSELQPLAMHDNGRQTFMRLSAAHAMPAAFILEPDGQESLVDFHVEGDTMVLHKVVDRILLRRGGLVAGITNRSKNLSTESSFTGTASEKVERIIREAGVE